jgi:hypothetical protein
MPNAEDLTKSYEQLSLKTNVKSKNGKDTSLIKDKIHVEVCQRSTSQLKVENLKPIVMNFLKKLFNSYSNGSLAHCPISTNGIFTKFEDEYMNEAVESITIPDFNAFLEVLKCSKLSSTIFKLFLF